MFRHAGHCGELPANPGCDQRPLVDRHVWTTITHDGRPVVGDRPCGGCVMTEVAIGVTIMMGLFAVLLGGMIAVTRGDAADVDPSESR